MSSETIRDIMIKNQSCISTILTRDKSSVIACVDAVLQCRHRIEA